MPLPVVKLEQKYLMKTYARYPVVLERGKGVWVYDSAGRKYLDLVSGLGVNALGYAHPRIVRMVRDQAGLALHISNLYYHPYQGPLAERLAKLAGMDRVFLCNSGTEAIEAAIKIARVAFSAQVGKTNIVALENSFHGRTIGALAATWSEKYRKPFAPLMPGVEFAKFENVGDLRAKVNRNTAAILIEPIQGEGGIVEVSDDYLRAAEETARKHGALLIADEIQCGMGRTGDMFAYRRSGVKPDMVVLAKPLAAGLPLGAVLARGAAAEAFKPGMHGTTFGGGPLACRAALEFLDILEEEKMVQHVRRMGTHFLRRLKELQKRNSMITAVRGRGLMLAINLDRPSRPLAERAIGDGLLVNSTADTVLRFLPPYIIEEAEIDKGIAILKNILK